MEKLNTHFSAKNNGFQFINSFTLSASGKKKIRYGLCGGMCLAALDAYTSHKTLPDITANQRIRRRMLVYLHFRQWSSLPTDIILHLLVWMRLKPATISHKIRRSVLPGLLSALHQEQPVLLMLIHNRKLRAVTENHQVIATGYLEDPLTHTLKIFIYDPNYGKQSTWLEIEDTTVPFYGRHSSGETCYGFFCSPNRLGKVFSRLYNWLFP